MDAAGSSVFDGLVDDSHGQRWEVKHRGRSPFGGGGSRRTVTFFSRTRCTCSRT